MLHALGAQHSEREIWWLHITRDAQSLAFGAEVSELIDSLANARQRVFFTAEVRQTRRGGGCSDRTAAQRDRVSVRAPTVHGRHA